MRKSIQILLICLISPLILGGCVSSKDNVFGTDMPTMVEIHNEKFNQVTTDELDFPVREVDDDLPPLEPDFQWLPNPVMTMYVTRHLTQAGQPVPGYTTIFRLYTTEHLAMPGEMNGWE
ncbi:MAG: hypothetical protein COA71_00255 [SAR86 cluster bacterium]|uniref:TIGR03751 family conjugal transfer lipoprotein n=1 Tax=SAR86 cluster bacterium TaxID=2030880 RepID=A0A2A5CHT5_9GAMM|nr:MAG: hypothetical protein COA71_00255 [SAR86 cluster bacterium]